MKSVLISIKPEWCELIASGKKTIEVRKTMPRLETPFKVYIYCTKNGNFMVRSQNNPAKKTNKIKVYGGKVIGYFTCDSIECFTTDYRKNEEQTRRMEELSCVSLVELADYETNAHCLYGWHISNLMLYTKPKKLSEFKKVPNGANTYRQEFLGKDFCIKYYSDLKLTRPPQSWCYVEELE